jgi:lysophospholipase L1-like esterase
VPVSGRRARSAGSAPTVVVAALAVIGALLAGCTVLAGPHPSSGGATGAAPAAVDALTDGPVAVFIGDSYTQGHSASEPGRRWTSVLSAAQGWQEVNLGRGGTGYVMTGTTGCGLEFCDRYGGMIDDAVAADPDIVVVAGGQNDRRARAAEVGRAVDGFYADLRAALPDAAIVAVGPTSPWGPTPFLDGLDARVASAAATADAHFVELYAPDVIEPSFVAADGIHVGDAGHAAIAGAVATALRELAPELDAARPAGR